MITIEQMIKDDFYIRYLVLNAKKIVKKLSKKSYNEKLDFFYLYIKPEICDLTGWDRKKGPEHLQTSEAYDVLYEHILDLIEA